MRVALVRPPYEDQPDLFGVRVANLISPGSGVAIYTELKIAVAFVKLSGLGRLAEALDKFRDGGGVATLVSGVNMRGTSYQGLEQALKLFDHVYVHEGGNRRIFHPKLFILKEAESAVVFIGSNNLTSGGLYINHELATRIDLDLDETTDESFFADVDRAFSDYCKVSLGATRLTKNVLDMLMKDGLLSDETRPDPRPMEVPSVRRSRTKGAGGGGFAEPPDMPANYAIY